MARAVILFAVNVPEKLKKVRAHKYEGEQEGVKVDLGGSALTRLAKRKNDDRGIQRNLTESSSV